MSRTLFKAKYVYPVSSSVIEDGGVLVENGIIIKVDKLEEFLDSELEDVEVVNYINGLILPGLINAHTHLEFTAAGKITAKSFVDFLLQSIEKTSGWNEAKIRESIKLGIKQTLECGVTTIADISRWGLSPLVISESPVPLLADVGIEAYSYDQKSSEDVYPKLLGKIKFIQSRIAENVRLSIAPHSPYNTHTTLWEKIIPYTIDNNMLIQSHIMESLEEKKWFEYGSSEIDKLHSMVGWPKITPEITSMSPVEYMSTMQLLSPNLIAVHLVYASLRDLELLEDKGVTVVICPRSNINLHQKILDYTLLKHLKIKPLLGTDGATSSGNLNFLEDIRLYNSRFQLTYEEITKMVTITAAKALKFDHLVGSLSAGKRANLAVFDPIDVPSSWINHSKPADVVVDGISIYNKANKTIV